MSTAIGLIVQLLPALAGSPVTRAAPELVPDPAMTAPAPLVGQGGIEWAALVPVPVDTPVTRRRTRAIEYGSGYNTRLKLHRLMSWAMIPFFAGSYITGNKLADLGRENAPGWARSLHGPLAYGTGVLFVGNTITGAWNLWASRKDPAGRTKRWIHGLAFIAADAGLAWSAASSPGDDNEAGKVDRHRNIALVSMGVAVSSWGLMLFFK